MFQDYVVYDNVFKYPDEIANEGKTLEFFDRQDESNAPGGTWVGRRSGLIHQVRPPLFKRVFRHVLKKFDLGEEGNPVTYGIEPFFQFTYSHNKFKKHKDNALFTGIVYLNEDADKNAGTTLFIGDEEVKIENVYNRLLLFRSNIPHMPTNLFDERFNLVFYINNITLKN